ncbi:MFS transporter [Pseudonocardia alaniniphila]|uniref:MFS transporter n=1 Tax=Pseudonocardia alaniniphila TaxID=75291 RepID=A0ABS9TGW4_9PSEU|nr:MFS transporter [Pseudonocardia alaniniphila]MCH6167771.1 MFS transporter [Pseudonocardia alaniniphila]
MTNAAGCGTPRRTTHREATEAPDGGASLSRGLLLLMAAATGLSVANNYFAQPLLDLLGRELQLSATAAGMIITAAQVGYGLGLLLLVPLGDLVERRRLAVLLYAATAVFLLVSATAPNGTLLLAGTALTAFTSVAAQVVVPYAATLAPPGRRGRVIGTVMSGLLLGALLSRAVSGALAELGGWRTVYWVSAILVAGMTVLLWRFLPRLHTPSGLSYPALLRSTIALFRHEPALRWRAGIAALSLASFNVLWTAATFLLAGPHYGWSEAVIGLFGLVGAVGTVTTTVAGRLADSGYVQWVTGIGTAALAASWLLIGAAESSLAWLVGGVIVLNVAHQAVLNSNQNVIYALRPEIRNRLNAALLTAFFAGGAAGSALAGMVWVCGGWTAVSVLGGSLASGTLVLWVLERTMTSRSLGSPASAGSPN